MFFILRRASNSILQCVDSNHSRRGLRSSAPLLAAATRRRHFTSSNDGNGNSSIGSKKKMKSEKGLDKEDGVVGANDEESVKEENLLARLTAKLREFEEERDRRELELKKAEREAREEERRALEVKERIKEAEANAREHEKAQTQLALELEAAKARTIEAEAGRQEQLKRIRTAEAEYAKHKAERIRAENESQRLQQEARNDRRRALLNNMIRLLIGMLGLLGTAYAFYELRERNRLEQRAQRRRRFFEPERQRARVRQRLAREETFDDVLSNDKWLVRPALEQELADMLISQGVPLLFLDGSYGSGKSALLKYILCGREAVVHLDLAQELPGNGSDLIEIFLTGFGYAVDTETSHMQQSVCEEITSQEWAALRLIRDELAHRKRLGEQRPIVVFDNASVLSRMLTKPKCKKAERFLMWAMEALSGDDLATIVFAGESHARMTLDRWARFKDRRAVLHMREIPDAHVRRYLANVVSHGRRRLTQDEIEKIIRTLGGRIDDISRLLYMYESELVGPTAARPASSPANVHAVTYATGIHQQLDQQPPQQQMKQAPTLHYISDKNSDNIATSNAIEFKTFSINDDDDDNEASKDTPPVTQSPLMSIDYLLLRTVRGSVSSIDDYLQSLELKGYEGDIDERIRSYGAYLRVWETMKTFVDAAEHKGMERAAAVAVAAGKQGVDKNDYEDDQKFFANANAAGAKRKQQRDIGDDDAAASSTSSSSNFAAIDDDSTTILHLLHDSKPNADVAYCVPRRALLDSVFARGSSREIDELVAADILSEYGTSNGTDVWLTPDSRKMFVAFTAMIKDPLASLRTEEIRARYLNARRQRLEQLAKHVDLNVAQHILDELDDVNVEIKDCVQRQQLLRDRSQSVTIGQGRSIRVHLGDV